MFQHVNTYETELGLHENLPTKDLYKTLYILVAITRQFLRNT
jgi:hypothetical protein